MRDTSMYAIERKRGEQAVEALTHGFRYELRRPTFPAFCFTQWYAFAFG